MRPQDSKTDAAPSRAVLSERGQVDPATMPRRALVVEDEERLAALVAHHLTTLGFVVQVEHDGEAGLIAALSPCLSLIILDVVLPGRSGFEISCEVRRQQRTTPILMLSARGITEDRVRGLDSGADDYLTKPFEFTELSARVRALLRRQTPAISQHLASGDIRLDLVQRTATRGQRHIDLTPREFALLAYLLEHDGQTLTRAMITEQVWRFTWDRLTNVIDVYVNHLRRKLEEGGEPRVIHAVRGVGYVLRTAGPSDVQDA